MKYLYLEEVKAQARIEHDEEDELLELYGSSAEDSILNLLGRSVESLYDEYGEIPRPVRHATLALASQFYKEREGVSNNMLYAVPYFYDIMLKPYIRLV